MKEKEKEAIELYKSTGMLIAELFCKKYDMSIEYELPGGAGFMIGDLYVSIYDMITCLEKDISIQKFLEWYDYAIEIGIKNSDQDSKVKDMPIISLKVYSKYGDINKLNKL